MAGERTDRRLAAILAADEAGYSRLMGADEVGTLAALKAIRREVVDPALADHKGRIFKTTGDGLLVEFASAVDAVTCAMAVQAEMAERNGEAAQRIAFRIGINVGDIIIDGDDIFGDGVNVAARVENECAPGAVCLSDDAFRQVRGKTAFVFTDLGERQLKNIDRPVRLYAVRSAPITLKAPAVKPPALPDRPSIAVLPFQNMSGDPEQEYFADGMVEDIITALSRFKLLFVIARNSSFTYKGKAVDIKQVGRELGVRYVLEGSVRRAGGRVRITGQLIEAATNRHIWADRFDGVLQDVFDLQDQVTSAVVARLLPSLEDAERERSLEKPTDDLDSYDFFLRGGAVQNSDPLEALKLFKKAIGIDPKFAGAYAGAVAAYASMQSFRRGLAPEEKCEAITFARESARLGTNDAFSLARGGHALAYIGREYDRGLSFVDKAIALNPNLGVAQMLHGHTCVLCSELERAVESYDRIIRLSPLDPLMPHILYGRSFALSGLDRHEEGYADAVQSLQSVVSAQGLGALITNAVASGRSREAKEAASHLLQIMPGFSLSATANAFHTKNPEMLGRLLEHFRAAGLPE